MPALTSAPTLSPKAYDCLAKLLYQHSRIRLGPDKHALVSGRLTKRLRQLGLDSFDEYCQLLESGQRAEELSVLVDFMSTNHTSFFREAQHFSFLREHALPEWMPKLVAAGQPLRVWSAACSSGEEPYTLAIVLAEFVRRHGECAWKIEASDISTRVLERAREGIYPAERVTLPQADLLPRYFQRGMGPFEGSFRVKDCLRQQIAFRHMNLFQAQYPVAQDQHLIFCRNVMIYFDQDTQQELLDKLVRQLAPGGYLVVGHSESLLGIRHSLKPVQAAVYRRE